MLRFIAFIAVFAATATAVPSSAGSPGEQALFGYASSDSYLFGSEAKLFGAPNANANPNPNKKPQQNDIEKVAEVKANTTAKTKEPQQDVAFVVKNNPTAFVNHHPMYPTPLN